MLEIYSKSMFSGAVRRPEKMFSFLFLFEVSLIVFDHFNVWIPSSKASTNIIWIWIFKHFFSKKKTSAPSRPIFFKNKTSKTSKKKQRVAPISFKKKINSFFLHYPKHTHYELNIVIEIPAWGGRAGKVNLLSKNIEISIFSTLMNSFSKMRKYFLITFFWS